MRKHHHLVWPYVSLVDHGGIGIKGTKIKAV